MVSKPISAETGRAALRAFFREGSPLGPLKVLARHVGRFFQIPIPGFRPFVVFQVLHVSAVARSWCLVPKRIVKYW